MFAIVETGGKQYRIEEGMEFDVEALQAAPGSSVSLDKVLLVAGDGAPKIGAPYLDGAAVDCEVITRARGPKIIVFHKRAKKDSRKTQGHRQDYTRLKVKSIKV